MYEVDDNKITLTRGDTFYAMVEMTRDDEPYTPVEGDVLRFYLKRAEMNRSGTEYKDPEPLITVNIPIATCLLKLESEDTKDLKFGEYVYDIELTFANGDVDTFINNCEFELVPEVG